MTTVDLAELQRTVRRIADRQELADLVARYGRYVDDRDLDAVGRLYTSDCEFESREGPLRGRDAVIEYYRAQLASYTITYHYPHSQTVDFVDDATATGVVQAHAELAIGGTGVIVALRYTDEYRREDGAWRFRSRHAQQLYGMPMDELAARLGDDARKRWPGSDPAPADIPESLPTYRAFFGLD
jgi:uncharacterized protein (TIGR02246 family)